ncbi:MAG: hypothetical protein LBS97_07120 [Treponema sp.]|jgi:hypothetical protein|nr:hypothetical protein [Treponema sp.]
MIETYNESHLHRTLKILYAEQSGGLMEQEVEGKICDIVAESGEIIEIQTGNIGKLAGKIARLVQNHKVRLVYPLVTEKYIETLDEKGALLSKRKSPQKAVIYSIFRELTGIYPWLLHENFLLEALEVTVTEKRIRTPKPIQLANKSRRFLRNWYKSDKELRSAGNTWIFAGAASYTALLPFEPGKEFSVRDLANAGAGKNASLMIWVLVKAGIITFREKRGKSNYYVLPAIGE